MLSWAPIRYAHNGDASIAYSIVGEGPVDTLFMGGFVPESLQASDPDAQHTP